MLILSSDEVGCGVVTGPGRRGWGRTRLRRGATRAGGGAACAELPGGRYIAEFFLPLQSYGYTDRFTTDSGVENCR